MIACPIGACEYRAQTEAALASHLMMCPERARASRDRRDAGEPGAPQRRIRGALYARVSTDEGEQDPLQQIDALREEAQRRGWVVVWVGADATTGASEIWERVEGRQLWKLVKEGRIDAIMTWDTSRLSRQHPTSVFRMLALLERYHVAFVSHQERYFDTSTDNDFRDIIVFIVAWFNNYFLRQLRAATRRGKKKSAAMGTPQGRHPAECGKSLICPTGVHPKAPRGTNGGSESEAASPAVTREGVGSK